MSDEFLTDAIRATFKSHPLKRPTVATLGPRQVLVTVDGMGEAQAAKLLEAAPALLNALDLMVSNCQPCWGTGEILGLKCRLCRTARAALEKVGAK